MKERVQMGAKRKTVGASCFLLPFKNLFKDDLSAAIS